MSELKPIKKESLARALEKAERYRLLNEPFESESICLDILALVPDHGQALTCLLLSLTDQFNQSGGQAMERARALLPRFDSEYERAYYSGIISERFAKRKLREGRPGARSLAFGHLQEAMVAFESAEKLAPAGNDDAALRYNACVRLIERQGLVPAGADDAEHEQPLE